MVGMTRKKIPWLVLLILVLGGGAVVGVRWWRHARIDVTTDDAYVRSNIIQITSRIPGVVQRVLVDDNWAVRAGEALVILDPRDLVTALEQAEATLALARARLASARLTVPFERDQTRARVAEAAARVASTEKGLAEAQEEWARAREQEAAARATLEKASADRDRFRELFRDGAVSREQLDEAVKNRDVAEANHQAALAARRAAEARIESLRHQITQSRAQVALAETGWTSAEIRAQEVLALEADVARARADRELARLQVSYTTIIAPADGYVSKKSVEAGQRVQPGQPLMAVVPLRGTWVEANYKETELTRVRIGQPAEIRADIYPGYVFQGRVDSISAGSGAAFSLLPPENALGNWIKVVQRVPVKIVLEAEPPPDRPLRVGLSVVTTIDTSRTTGLLLRAPEAASRGLGLGPSPPWADR